ERGFPAARRRSPCESISASLDLPQGCRHRCRISLAHHDIDQRYRPSRKARGLEPSPGTRAAATRRPRCSDRYRSPRWAASHRHADWRIQMRILKNSVVAGTVLALASGLALGAEVDTQKQIDAIKAVIPKFAIPMREVGDRFQNMYFAANKGNWALAAYMSKYMNNAMNPASLTKANEYAVWKTFYETGFANVNKSIQAKDLAGF